MYKKIIFLILIFFPKVIFSLNSKNNIHFIMDPQIKGGPIYVAGIAKENGDILCTGLLIKENIILTASHCVRDDFSKIIFTEKNEIKKQVKIAGFMSHPDFNQWNFENDVGLYILSENLPKNWVFDTKNNQEINKGLIGENLTISGLL